MLMVTYGSSAITYHDAIKERDGVWVSKAKEYAIVKQTLRELQNTERRLQTELRELSQGVDSKGGGYIFTCTLRKGVVRYEDIPELKNVDLDRFRSEPVEVWKIERELK